MFGQIPDAPCGPATLEQHDEPKNEAKAVDFQECFDQVSPIGLGHCEKQQRSCGQLRLLGYAQPMSKAASAGRSHNQCEQDFNIRLILEQKHGIEIEMPAVSYAVSRVRAVKIMSKPLRLIRQCPPNAVPQLPWSMVKSNLSLLHIPRLCCCCDDSLLSPPRPPAKSKTHDDDLEVEG